ncbi:uncharacterized protein LOC115877465 [Sitophilus oryzae]|uniref:Uncharacterized protein LOC115877463 n=1 Tax=Sitophilus oryzae TaxID=7048 RepID=A0A6J2XDR6_SITOR|nr:uncharacterized protein LOC115877463 [Sitophilus oryzae]XP_030749478.1 uncharacterized protein LOC115877465 [Sitophilus oryzae]
MKSAVILVLVATFAFASCKSLIVQDEDGQVYSLTPISSRQKREEPKWYGGGGANSKQGGGVIGVVNPNGSGAQVKYGHANGYGHDFSVDAKVPVWSNGPSTLNVGGGFDRHVGGWGGSHTGDKRVGISFNHRF